MDIVLRTWLVAATALNAAYLAALHAMFALAEDYFRAGLFDRAEQLFRQLADGGPRHGAALRYLLRIYEQQRDWEQAIAAHGELVRVASAEHPTAIAHYHCELAEQARERGDSAAAREHLGRGRSAGGAGA